MKPSGTGELSTSLRTRLSQFTPFPWGVIVLAASLLVFLGLVIRAWHSTWDDSGITLAFARNLARYGDIIPAANNSRVEGYSTFLWMLINAFFFKIGFSENGVLLIAKVLATFFALLNIAGFYFLLQRAVRTPQYRIIALLLYATSSYTVASAVDGMETSLYASLVLFTFLSFSTRNTKPWFYLASSLLILIRHEGAIFLVPFALILLLERGKNILREPCIFIWAAVFFIYHGWHYAYFGELLTNPMLAKRFWPYRPDITNLSTAASFYLTPFIDFFLRYISFFFILLASLIVSSLDKLTHPRAQVPPNKSLILAIALTGLVLMGITGANWGAAARLSFPALPFIFILLISAFDSKERLASSRLLQISALVGFLLNAAVVFQTNSALLPDIITLAGVERRASSISAVQGLLMRPQITFAGVDMGGLLLYHADGKKIIDLALLCDKYLATNGYAKYEDYVFNQNNPDIIEAHGQWLTPLRESPDFAKSYTPVMVLTKRNEQILYIRNDLVSELQSTHTLTISTARAGYKDIDQPTLEQLGSFLVLDIRGLPQ